MSPKFTVGDTCKVKLTNQVFTLYMDVVAVYVRKDNQGFSYKMLDRNDKRNWIVNEDSLTLIKSVSAKSKGGRPHGTPGGGRYGCRTKVVRVPYYMAENIDKILLSFQDIKSLIDNWDENIQEKTSPRYEQAKKMLNELRSCLGD